MSEVIVRMEKVPKNCDDGCWGYLSGECPWSDHVDGYTMNGVRPRNCPIKGVLPEQHERLVSEKDVRWAIDDIVLEIASRTGRVAMTKNETMKYVNRLPTIIAAEREDDGNI